jgi:hypothetical protein
MPFNHVNKNIKETFTYTYIIAFDYLRNSSIEMLHPLPYLHLERMFFVMLLINDMYRLQG